MAYSPQGRFTQFKSEDTKHSHKDPTKSPSHCDPTISSAPDTYSFHGIVLGEAAVPWFNASRTFYRKLDILCLNVNDLRAFTMFGYLNHHYN